MGSWGHPDTKGWASPKEGTLVRHLGRFSQGKPQASGLLLCYLAGHQTSAPISERGAEALS